MLYRQSKPTLLWLMPWDPIYTPFTRSEMLDLAFVGEPVDNTRSQIRAEASWVHPDDPLNRFQHYNFWDVLQEAFNRRILVSRGRNMLDDSLVAELIDYIAREIDQESSGTDRSCTFGFPRTCAARIHRIITGIKAGLIAPDIPCLLKHPESQTSGLDTLAMLLQETLDLILRIETLLQKCHPEHLNRTGFARGSNS